MYRKYLVELQSIFLYANFSVYLISNDPISLLYVFVLQNSKMNIIVPHCISPYTD